jgi:DNA polymerase elongation subunit (family B)
VSSSTLTEYEKEQYYGVTHEGQLVVRGVEVRRHDTPKFIKEFQTENIWYL